ASRIGMAEASGRRPKAPQNLAGVDIQGEKPALVLLEKQAESCHLKVTQARRNMINHCTFYIRRRQPRPHFGAVLALVRLNAVRTGNENHSGTTFNPGGLERKGASPNQRSRNCASTKYGLCIQRQRQAVV